MLTTARGGRCLKATRDWASNLCNNSEMVFEHRPDAPASRSWRRRAMWPLIPVLMAIIGAIGGLLLASH